VQRLFSAKDMKTVNNTLFFNGLLRFPITLTYCLMGLVIGTLVMTQADFRALIPADKPDLMIPIFIREYLPHGVMGILLVAILSAAMSSLSSAINSLSAATVEDYFNRDKQLSSEKYMRYSRYAALFWGVVCIVLAFFTGDIAKTVIEAINKIGSVFYGPILATFIAAIGVKRINAKGANIGLLSGVAINIYLWLFVPELFWFWWNAVGAVTTLLIGYVGSLLLPNFTSESSEETLEFNFSLSAIQEPMKPILLVLFFILIVLVSMSIPSWFA
jgi:Na+/proline symporter